MLATPHLLPMPVFYDNVPLSVLAVMLFPDNVILARKLVARLLTQGTLQGVLNTGVRIDPQYMIAILDDLKDGQPDPKLVKRRRYWASACGQTVKALFALINSDDERVRERAAWERAIKIAELQIGRTRRGNRSSLHVQLRRFAPVLHFCGAFELAREPGRPPLTIEALLLNAMTLYGRLWDWHAQRQWRGKRNQFLEGNVFWRWAGSEYDPSSGVPDIGISFERLPPYRASRPPQEIYLKNVFKVFCRLTRRG